MPAAFAAFTFVAFGIETVAFLRVIVPELFAPIVRLVAAPAKLTVVAAVLNRFADVAVVVIFPPFTARFPEVVIFPLLPVMLKLDPTTSFAPSASAVTIFASERSIAVVIGAPPDEVTLIPAGSVFVVA